MDFHSPSLSRPVGFGDNGLRVALADSVFARSDGRQMEDGSLDVGARRGSLANVVVRVFRKQRDRIGATADVEGEEKVAIGCRRQALSLARKDRQYARARYPPPEKPARRPRHAYRRRCGHAVGMLAQVGPSSG